MNEGVNMEGSATEDTTPKDAEKDSTPTTPVVPTLTHADKTPENRWVMYKGDRSESQYGGQGAMVKGVPREVPATELLKFTQAPDDFDVLTEAEATAKLKEIGEKSAVKSTRPKDGDE